MSVSHDASSRLGFLRSEDAMIALGILKKAKWTPIRNGPVKLPHSWTVNR
jgi:hypothetical protein